MTAKISASQASAFGSAPCAPCAVADPLETAPPPVGTSVDIVDPAKRGWIAIRVLDPEDHPVAGAPLRVVLPDGVSRHVRVNRAGRVRIEGISSGVCTVSLTDRQMVMTETYKVRTGDTLDSIAARADRSWQELATLNWGTDDPDDVNEMLRDEVGCTVRGAKGNCLLSDDAHPGTLVVPKDPHRLQTEQLHDLKLHAIPGPYITLENEEGIRLPEVAFEVRFADGTHLSGRLSRAGRYRLVDPPHGKFFVTYPDQPDMLAKSLAASTHAAFDSDECRTHQLFRLLAHETDIVRAAITAYDTYWNDLSGKGLVADVDRIIEEDEVREIADVMLASHGVKTKRPVTCVLMSDIVASEEQLT
jgi:hypothetical protein